MDELMLKLKTAVLKKIVSRLISKQITKTCGYKVAVQLNDLQIDVNGENANLHADINLGMATSDLTSLIETLEG